MIVTTPWVRRGGVYVRETDSPSLLAPQLPTSFLRDFDFSVNPLAGCPFGCPDCYVLDFAATRFRREALPDGRAMKTAGAWGAWVEVRVRAPEILGRALEQGKLDGSRLFMSPMSDVYWPGEGGRDGYRLTRRLLELLAEHPVFDWLLISTRSDLVLRDIDVFQQLGDKVEVGISIPTDREDVKAVFGRHNPSLKRRFAAAEVLVEAGIPVRIHVAPLQPHTSDFAAKLAEAGNWIWLDWHQHSAVGFPRLYEEHGWSPSTPHDAEVLAEQLRARLGAARVRIGQSHFADRWKTIALEIAGAVPSDELRMAKITDRNGTAKGQLMDISSSNRGPKTDTEGATSGGQGRLRIEPWRRAFALSQHGLARYAGLDRKTVRRAEERGEARPETVRRLAGVFGVAPLKLYYDPRPEEIGAGVPREVPKRRTQ